MELAGSYTEGGYVVEAYFPDPEDPDRWAIWVVRDGHVIAEFATWIVVNCAYGMDQPAMDRLGAAADAAVREVVHREALNDDEVRDAPIRLLANG